MRTYTDQYLDENRLDLENRIKNMVWTICGDYTLELRPDADLFKKSRDAALLEGIRQGGLAKYLDRDALTLYLAKKIYCQAEAGPLMIIARLCMDRAVCGRLEAERAGVRAIQKSAYEQIIDQEFHALDNTVGQFRTAAMRVILDGGFHGTARMEKWLALMEPLDDTSDTGLLIRIIDELYNQVVDPFFEKYHGSLEQVLAVTIEEMTEYSWKDFLNDSGLESSFEIVLDKITEEMTGLNLGETEEKQEKEQKEESPAAQTVVVDQEQLDRMYRYVQMNFGRSCLNAKDEKMLNYQLCRGIHAGCHVYFTEGILKNPVIHNSVYELIKKQKAQNIVGYKHHYQLVRNSIRTLSRILKNALELRDEEEIIHADYGQIRPNQLWKIGRTTEEKLFDRVIRNDDREFVVDILIDASGSQRVRQKQVVLQAYILSETLSNLKIPFRVMSFCTFWSYTVLQRFRDYEDDRRENENVFEFATSSSNRDGLAIRAAAAGLLQRKENHKIMIILSDGKPNDLLVRRTEETRSVSYEGRTAVADTAAEVRALRRMDVAVLGVFVGNESELSAEKKIFGKDFAYIRSIEKFSNVVGRYLLKQLED